MADVFVKQYVLYLYQLREIVTEYYLKGYIIGKTKSTIFQNEKFKKLDKG